jgi:hypothetical protein
MNKARSVVGSIALAGTSLAWVAVGAAPAGASSQTQAYSCSTPIGTQSSNVTVAGSASINTTTKKISLTGVKFTITNTFGVTFSANNVKISIPDPNKTSAPYVAGSAKVATSPAGWTAGHDSTGVFALHSGTITVANGQTVSNAALSAKYSDKGPAGKVIKFHPGTVSFSLTSPITGSVTCHPTAPVITIASVTE